MVRDYERDPVGMAYIDKEFLGGRLGEILEKQKLHPRSTWGTSEIIYEDDANGEKVDSGYRRVIVNGVAEIKARSDVKLEEGDEKKVGDLTYTVIGGELVEHLYGQFDATPEGMAAAKLFAEPLGGKPVFDTKTNKINIVLPRGWENQLVTITDDKGKSTDMRFHSPSGRILTKDKQGVWGAFTGQGGMKTRIERTVTEPDPSKADQKGYDSEGRMIERIVTFGTGAMPWLYTPATGALIENPAISLRDESTVTSNLLRSYKAYPALDEYMEAVRWSKRKIATGKPGHKTTGGKNSSNIGKKGYDPEGRKITHYLYEGQTREEQMPYSEELEELSKKYFNAAARLSSIGDRLNEQIGLSP